MITLYVALVAGLLFAYAFYLHTARTYWSEHDVRRIEQLELHLPQVIRLLEAPDVRMLMEDPSARTRIFLDFSRNLKEDVKVLWRLGALTPIGLFYVGLFYLSYYLLRLKAALLFCHKTDLHYLARVTWSAALYRKG